MYLTIYQHTIEYITYNNIMQHTPCENEFYKHTIKIDNPTPKQNLSTTQLKHIQNVEETLHYEYALLKPFTNPEEHYYEFKIPKRSGGLRTINAPTNEFKAALTTVKDLFESKIKCLPHPAAHAYVKNTSAYDALVKHQKNNSNWYLKIDLKDFFTNCTPELIFNQLMQIYPFYYINTNTQQILKNIINKCCLNGGLPQGTPISPLLTNLLMVPYDYEINNYLKRGTGKHT